MSKEQGFETDSSAYKELTLGPDLSLLLQEQLGSHSVAEVYEDSLELRGNALYQASFIAEALKGSDLEASINNLRNGTLSVLVVHGIPVDPEAGDPPADGGNPVHKPTYYSEGMSLAMGNILGIPSMLVDEKKEALIHQITPVKGREYTQSNEGSVGLKFHQDLAPIRSMPALGYDRFMPDWLILTGVQSGDGSTKTFISPVAEAVCLVDEAVQDVLRQNRFTTDPPDSFAKEGLQPEYRPPIHAILKEYKDKVESAYDSSSNVRVVDASDHEAIAALQAFEQALQQVKREVAIKPGTSVIFNNRRVVHGRSAINPKDAASPRRWIQRLYVMDLDRVIKSSMGRLWSVAIGGGLLSVQMGLPSERLLELAGVQSS